VDFFKNSLKRRLIGLILLISAPVIVGIALYLFFGARQSRKEELFIEMDTRNIMRTNRMKEYLQSERRLLEQLSYTPQIQSMNPSMQKPLLDALVKSHNFNYLASTVDLEGMNIARSDSLPAKNYSDRPWFIEISSGIPISYQTLIGRTNQQPALVMAIPIKKKNKRVGIIMIATRLMELTNYLNAGIVGESGYAYVLNENDIVVAHPDKTLLSEKVN